MDNHQDNITEVTEETLNTRTALWLRNKSEVKPEEYDAFYQQISNDSEKPARVIHYTAEGLNEFKVLAFIPAHKPFSLTWEEPRGLKLYIQRVLIMDSCEGLLPPYLAIPCAIAIIISGALYFADTQMKTKDNYFLGFPAVWNVPAFYLLLLRPDPWVEPYHAGRCHAKDRLPWAGARGF